MFKRATQPSDVSEPAILASMLPQSLVAEAITQYVDSVGFPCQVCGQDLLSATLVQRRAWYRAEENERRNYIHADARRCIENLRAALEQHTGERGGK